MGNIWSTKKKFNIQAEPESNGQQSQGKTLSTTKKILLLHKSNPEQLKIVKYFRDALTAKANGSVRVTDFVNIADGGEKSISLSWLDKLNNIVLICLTSEAIEQLEKIVREKRLVDEEGHLHGRVFSVSLGESPTGWPPEGLEKGSLDARDFHFGFPDIETLKPRDFEESDKMSALVAAIRGTN